MRGLIKLGLLGGLAAFAYKTFNKSALAGSNRGATPGTGHIRDAGPEQQRGIANEDWDTVDEQVDESFPASDPPGNY